MPSTLYATDAATGARTTLATTGNPRDAYTAGDTIVFTTDTGTMGWRASEGVRPAFASTTGLFALGDSLTDDAAHGGWAAEVTTLTGASNVNLGIQGQTTTHMAVRFGALPLILTPAGGSIPASGSVNVTPTPASTWSAPATLTWTMPGTLAGIHGILNYSANPWTFTRDTTGSATTVPAGSVFTPDLDTAMPSRTATAAAKQTMGVYWGGRNNVKGTTVNLADVKRDDEAIMAAMGSTFPKTLILGVTTLTTENKGTPGYAAVASINAWRAARWPNQFLDVRRYLIDHALTDMGLTPTADDLTDIANDNIPRQLHSDTTHFTPATQAAIGEHLIVPAMTQRGWTTA